MSEVLEGNGAPAGWDCHVHVFESAATVASGHYRPARQTLADIEVLAAAHGVGHLVFVQPSIYGADNAVLLCALASQPGLHRGVVVLDDGASDSELELLHAVGVRGARLNLVSPVGETEGDIERRFLALAPRLRELGWHLQWYAAPAHLARIAALHAKDATIAVLDHLAGLPVGLAADDPAWHAVRTLADAGAWLKLSGWYRLGAAPPYDALLGHVQRLNGLFGGRLVWGSDWPHTSFAAGAAPAYATTFEPVVAALGLPVAQALRQACASIYR